MYTLKHEIKNRRRFVYEIENFNYKNVTYEEYQNYSDEAKEYIIEKCPREDLNDLVNRILDDEQKELFFEIIQATEAADKAKEAADKAKEAAQKLRKAYVNKKKKAMRRMKKHIEKTSGNIQY